MNVWTGINYPFKGGQQKFLSKQSDARIVKNDILQLLYTNPGERVYRPNFGVGLSAYLFEMDDDNTVDALRDKINEQMNMYESSRTSWELDVIKDSDNHVVYIRMKCELIRNPGIVFDINLNLQTGSTK